jgi:hypothetical protein
MPKYDLTEGQLKDLAAFLLSLDFRGGIEPVERDCSAVLEEAK